MENSDLGRSGSVEPSGLRPSDGAAEASPAEPLVPNAVTRAEAETVLAKMIEDRRTWAANNVRMLDLLQPEWDRFERRDGHNVYVARIFADHTSSLRKDRKELAALEFAMSRVRDRSGEAGETAQTGSIEDESPTA